MDTREVLGRLSAMAGPSGFERMVAMQAADLMRPFLDEANVDRFGNAVGVRLCGRPGAPRLLLDAHLDEIGLIVTGIEEGFLRFRTIGGVDPRMLPDRELTVLTDTPILGVVACLPPHVLKAEDKKKSIPIDELRVDIGMSQEEAQRRVPIGTPMVFRGSYFDLMNGKVCGKSMDDRSCFTILLRTAVVFASAAIAGQLGDYLPYWSTPSPYMVLLFLLPNFFLSFMPFWGEEYGWRYFLQPRLQSRFGMRGGVLVLGVLWGLWHLPLNFFFHAQSTPLQNVAGQLITCVTLGIFFAWAYLKTGNIWAPVLLHFFNNNLSVVYTGAAEISNQTVGWTNILAYLVLMGVAFLPFLASPVRYTS